MEIEQNIPPWTYINCSDSGKRHSHASTLYKDYIITFGGYNGIYLNDTIVFQTSKNEWKRITTTGDVPIARSGHTMDFAGNNNIIVYGGVNYPKVLSEIGEMTISNLENNLSIGWNTVKTKTKNAPSRAFHTQHLCGNYLYVFGGKDESLRSTNTTWRFNFETLTWMRCKATGTQPEERHSHCSILYNKKLFVFGGCSTQKSTRFNDLYTLDLGISLEMCHLNKFDKVEMKWHRISQEGLIPSPRSGASSLERNGKIYIFGGCNIDGNHTNDLYAYSIKDQAWNQILTEKDSPPPRYWHSAVLVQKDMFIWGGYQNDQSLSDIYYLNLEDMEMLASNPVKTKETLKGTQITQILNKIFDERIFTDIVFQVGDQEFHAHKNIVAGSCKYFYHMFTSGMMESYASRIEVKDITPTAFKAFLEFIYNKQVSLDETLALELIQITDKYSLPELKKECEIYLGQILNEKNYCKFANSADIFDAFILREAILKFIHKNLPALKHKDNFSDLPESFVMDLGDDIITIS